MKRKGIALLLVMMLAVQLSACGGASSSAAPASQAASTQEAAAGTQEATPAESAQESASAESTQEAAQASSAEPAKQEESGAASDEQDMESTIDALESAIAEAEEAAVEEEADEEGTYYTLTYMKDGDQEYDSSIISLFGECYLYLANDGTGKIVMMDEENELTWEDGKLIANDEEVPYTLTGDVLRLEDEDGMVMEFTKGKPEQMVTDSFADLVIEYDESTRAGYYKLYSFVEDGKEISAALFAAFDVNIYLVLNEDGTGVINLSGTDYDITWDDECITAEGGPKPYTYESGKISLDVDDEMMNFVYAGTPDSAPAAEE